MTDIGGLEVRPNNNASHKFDSICQIEKELCLFLCLVCLHENGSGHSGGFKIRS